MPQDAHPWPLAMRASLSYAIQSSPTVPRSDNHPVGRHPATAELMNWLVERDTLLENPWLGGANPHWLASAGLGLPKSAEPMTPWVLSPVCGSRFHAFMKPLLMLRSALGASCTPRFTRRFRLSSWLGMRWFSGMLVTPRSLYSESISFPGIRSRPFSFSQSALMK